MDSTKYDNSKSSEEDQVDVDDLCYKNIVENYIEKELLNSPNDSPKISKYKFSIDLPNTSNEKIHEYLNEDLINAINLNSNFQNNKIEHEDLGNFSLDNNKDIIPSNKEDFPIKIKNKKNKIKEDKKENKKENKKRFERRKGDWTCPKCENLNFSFRDFCNRCGLHKDISLQNFYQNQKIMQQQNFFIPFLIKNNLNNMNYNVKNYNYMSSLRYFNGYAGNNNF